jgi:hypothetical protein
VRESDCLARADLQPVAPRIRPLAHADIEILERVREYVLSSGVAAEPETKMGDAKVRAMVSTTEEPLMKNETGALARLR